VAAVDLGQAFVLKALGRLEDRDGDLRRLRVKAVTGEPGGG
jgi:hypothetical protein